MIRKIPAAVIACFALFTSLPAVEVGEELEEIKGTALEMADGATLQLFVEENQVQAYFLDEDGLVMESPAESIAIYVDDSSRRPDDWRAVLKPGSDAGLTSPRRLYPPYTFRARVIIRMQEGDPVTFTSAYLELDKAGN